MLYSGPPHSGGIRKKERKVSLVLRHFESDTKHCSGVESVLVVPGYKILFTASRDSTIKRWNVSGLHPTWEASFEGHTDWVNDIVLVHDILLSCSNDKTVRIWKGASQGTLLTTLVHHSDYVTSLACSPNSSLVATAGLRGELFLVDMETGGPVKKLYPKATAFSSQNGTPPAAPLASRGGSSHHRPTTSLDDDDEMDGGPLAGGPNGGGGGNDGPSKASIFSLAMSAGGNLVAAGGADHLVRLWDPRDGSKVAKLRGHSDNVRALALSHDGTKALSGSSDGTVKLWDVGLQRCVQTYSVHSESVWALLALEDFSGFYSGGRDGAVYRTHLSTRTAELVASESRPVLGLALDGGDGSLWVSSEASTVNKWPAVGSSTAGTATSASTTDSWGERTVSASGAPSGSLTPLNPGISRSGGGGGSSGGGAEVAGAPLEGMSPALRLRHSAGVKRRVPEKAPSPLTSIHGIPGIVMHKVLNDRRHILTKDTAGNVSLWDVLSGSEVQSFGQVDFLAQERELFEPRAVPSWFTHDSRLGQISIWLEPPSCFSAEEYALDLGYPDVSDDAKVNLGKLVLEGALAKWRSRVILLDQRRQHGAPLPAEGVSEEDEGPEGDPSTSFVYSEPWPRYWQHDIRHQQRLLGSTIPRSPLRGITSPDLLVGGGGGGGSAPSSPLHKGLSSPSSSSAAAGGGAAVQRGALPAIASHLADGTPWRRIVSAFTGIEGDPEMLPSWMVDVVLRGAAITPKESKCSFILLPDEGSDMPQLMQSKLNAPRILQVHKVANYCLTKLQELNIQMVLSPKYIRRPVYLSKEVEAEPNPSRRPVLELLCNGMAVPYEMSLASVKRFLWRKGDDLVFHFRVMDPKNPVPLPTLLPPV